MCGRFTLTKDTKEITQRWRIGNMEVEVKPRYNIAPTQNVLIVTDEGARKLALAPALGYKIGMEALLEAEIDAQPPATPEKRLLSDMGLFFKKRIQQL